MQINSDINVDKIIHINTNYPLILLYLIGIAIFISNYLQVLSSILVEQDLESFSYIRS